MRALIAGCFTLMALHPSTAGAAACGKPDLLVTFPGDGEAAVPPNAELSAYYAPTAVYDDEPVLLERDGVQSDLPATFDESEVALHVVPPDGLGPGEYTLTWPRLRGTGTTAVGRAATVTFTVSGEPDVSPPKFDGLVGLDWDVARELDDCTDTLEERFVFDLRVGSATDAAGEDGLALVVFQTKGPRVAAGDAPRPVLVTPYPGEGRSVRVTRALADGGGEVCFAALARDLSPDNPPAGAETEVCAETRRPPFFYGCGVAARRAGGTQRGGGASAMTLALALSLGLRLRHRRRP